MEVKASRQYLNKRKLLVNTQMQATEIVSRKPCGFHKDRPSNTQYNGPRHSMVWKANPSLSTPEGQPRKNNVSKGSPSPVCRFWICGKCTKGDKCRFLHSWSLCPGARMLAALKGHTKDVKGIAFPLGSDKLYSTCDDGTLRVWDCHSGQCVHVGHLGGKAGSLISEGPWVFVGLSNAVKAFNIQTASEITLKGPAGQVNCMAVVDGMLFAGAADGVISVWKCDTQSDPFRYAASLKGHGGPVVSFGVGAQRLYSGSADGTISVWDLTNLQCRMTLKQHSGAVTGLLCWDQFLFSCSLDQTIKVWAAADNDSLEVIYTQQEKHGVLALSGIQDAEEKPLIFCSLNNKTVKVYDIPSFKEKGRMFSKQDVRILVHGPDGLLFTGEDNGNLSVWTLADQQKH